MNKLKKLKHAWNSRTRRSKIIIVLALVYLLCIAVYATIHAAFFSPDQFYVALFLFVLITGQFKEFLLDWTPPIAMILSYEYLRGLIPRINTHIHFTLMPKFDVLIFGRVPTVWLQQKLFDPNHLHWYDYYSVVFYLMHFIFPLFVGVIFWFNDRKYFREFMWAIVSLSYLTFLTYLVFPAAPPWMGSQAGVIPPIAHATSVVISHFLRYSPEPTVYRYFGANLTAAVPSLHAAYPLLTAMYIGKKVPKLIPILVIYVFSVWFAVIYMGEHYVFDVVLGAIYAGFVYAAAQRIKAWKPYLHGFWGRVYSWQRD